MGSPALHSQIAELDRRIREAENTGTRYLSDGHAAHAAGDSKKANECYAKSQHWFDMANLMTQQQSSLKTHLLSIDQPQEVGLSVEAVQKLVDDFLAEYNGNIPVTPVIQEKQEDIYGPRASREAIGFRIDGAYHPARHL
ncbi:hypothetical protein, partial [Taklimakanibacter deserti]|uniref:hypothetical protein n=1 Tax=Taklimakanibacter deserti TaxID=2267839 RepID=UPI0034D421C1